MREVSLVICAAALGWQLHKLWQCERERFLWTVRHEAALAALKARELIPDPPATPASA